MKERIDNVPNTKCIGSKYITNYIKASEKYGMIACPSLGSWRDSKFPVVYTDLITNTKGSNLFDGRLSVLNFVSSNQKKTSDCIRVIFKYNTIQLSGILDPFRYSACTVRTVIKRRKKGRYREYILLRMTVDAESTLLEVTKTTSSTQSRNFITSLIKNDKSAKSGKKLTSNINFVYFFRHSP